MKGKEKDYFCQTRQKDTRKKFGDWMKGTTVNYKKIIHLLTKKKVFDKIGEEKEIEK